MDSFAGAGPRAVSAAAAEVEGLEPVLQMFREGGIAMYPLLVCSIFVVAIALQRVVLFMRSRMDPITFTAELRRVLLSEGLNQGAAYCRAYDTPVTRVCLAAILQSDRSRESLQAALGNAVKMEGSRLEQALSTVGTIGALAPFIGLFGTVVAIRGSIQEISLTGRAGTSEIYGQIGEALVATAAGLLVGIVAVFIYNTLTNWADSLTRDMEISADEMSHIITEAVPQGPGGRVI